MAEKFDAKIVKPNASNIDRSPMIIYMIFLRFISKD
jgi:hypothetical protein